MIWYPSIGNSEYPYSTWVEKRPDAVWDMLGVLVDLYSIINRSLRNLYKWNPQTIDDIEFNRLLQIFKEAEEDQKDKPDDDL